MSNTISLEINKRTLSIDIGKVAKQADGSALVRYGDTMMLVTATSRRELKEDKDFLPLIVDYRENTYAAGKIPGGFFKREGRPSEREILIARLIDRPVRPLFPEGYFFDTQIVGLLLSADLENEPDTLGVIGASAALYFSDIPFTTPLGAVKVGLVDGQYVVNPTDGELDRSPLNITVVSNEDGIIMIEAGAKEIEEDKILEGLALAHETNQQIIRAQKDLFARLGIKKREFTAKPVDAEKLAQVEREHGPALLEAMQVRARRPTKPPWHAVRDAALAAIPEDKPEEKLETKGLFYKLEEKLFRELVLKKKLRTDGRGFDDIRPITSRGRPPDPDPRFGPVHPRRDPGPGHGHAGDLRGRPAARQPRRGIQEAVHAPLQLPAVLGRRGGLPAGPRPPRDRARRPGRKIHPPGHPRHGHLPLHHPHRLGHPGEQRLLVAWPPSAAASWP